MRIKTMTPAMIAALFPPKPKPVEAWRFDYPDEPADLPPPAPPETQPQAPRVSLVDILHGKYAEDHRAAAEAQPPRVSLVDILREKHAEDERAATGLNAMRLGHTQPPGGLFGNGVGPNLRNMEVSRFGVKSGGLSMPSMGFNSQQPLRTDFMRAAPSSI